METFVSVFKALSNETRWRILELLKRRPLCVNALVCHLKVSQPAVSQHLKILEHAGLVQGKKMGLQVHYALIFERLEEGIAALRSFLTQPEPGGSSKHERQKRTSTGHRSGKPDEVLRGAFGG